MSYSLTPTAKNFCIAYRARYEPETHFRPYFSRQDAARFWERVGLAYDKYVPRPDWDEDEFVWALAQLLRRSAPVTGRNLEKLHDAYLAQVAPVQSAAALVDVRGKHAVRSLVRDFNGIGFVEEARA